MFVAYLELWDCSRGLWSFDCEVSSVAIDYDNCLQLKCNESYMLIPVAFPWMEEQ